MWRPILAEPPLYTVAELKTVIRFKDVVEANFALDLKVEMNKKMARTIEARRR